jgi:hypothetical protein
MKLRRTEKRNMKIKVLIAGAVVAAFAFTSFAAGPLLSPRAKDSQVKVVTSSIDTQGGTISYIASESPGLLCPRAQAIQSRVVKGVATDANPSLACRNKMSGSPKAVAECSQHTTMPGCMNVSGAK